MHYKLDKLKRDKSSTDWNAGWKKAKSFDRLVSYIIEQVIHNYIEYFSELGILEQLNTTRFTEKLLHALPTLCSKNILKKSVVLFSDVVSTLVKDYIELLDDFLIAKDCTSYTKRTF